MVKPNFLNGVFYGGEVSHVILSFVVNIISVSKHYFITTKYFDQSSDIAVFEWRPIEAFSTISY